MSQNPFDALGGAGGLDMNALLQQAQQMQADLAAAQQQLAETVVEGVVGGAVTVRLSGVGDLVGVELAPGCVDGDDPESLADLGDMVVAAFRDAKSKTDQLAAEALGPLAGGGGGLPGMPGGGQLGF